MCRYPSSILQPTHNTVPWRLDMFQNRPSSYSLLQLWMLGKHRYYSMEIRLLSPMLLSQVQCLPEGSKRALFSSLQLSYLAEQYLLRWHGIFENLNYEQLQKVVRDSLVEGLPMKHPSVGVCQLGKDHRDVFPKSTSNWASKALALSYVHFIFLWVQLCLWIIIMGTLRSSS